MEQKAAFIVYLNEDGSVGKATDLNGNDLEVDTSQSLADSMVGAVFCSGVQPVTQPRALVRCCWRKDPVTGRLV